MPYIPEISTLSANTAGILNTIRSELGGDYMAAVPEAEMTTESIRAVGTAINGLEARRNSFIDALVNRIARVLVISKSYQNPLNMFKKGVIELGETVEEVFIQLATPFQFGSGDDGEVFKQVKPNVKSMFHPINFKKYYKTTVSNEQLRQAFLTINGVTDFISRIVNTMYAAMNVDEYIMVKYVLYTVLNMGSMPMRSTVFSETNTNEQNAKALLTSIRTVSNQMEFMRTDFTIAGVENYSLKNDQFLLCNAETSSLIDVNALAMAFNLSYAEFVGKQVMVDSFAFTEFELERLSKLLEDDPDFDVTAVRNANANLKAIPYVLVDRNFFMIFDNLYEATNIYNPQKLYWNQFLHTWKTFSVSPFAPAMAFTTEALAVNNITVNGESNVQAGKTYQYTATVTATGFTPKGVIWSVTGTTDSDTVISDTGLLTLGKNETACTVVATSVYNNTKTASKALTVS